MQQFEYDVFISYSRKDYVDENKNVIPGNIVSSIKELLDKERLSYWFDEDGIYSGDEYASLIATAIRTSRIFLFISSENSNASVWTSNEIASAHAYKRKIIPFKIDDSYYDDSVMLYIAKLDFIDYKANPEKGLKKLKKSITEYIHKQKQEEETHNAVEKRKELEDKKREEQEKELADIRRHIDEIAVRITDLKNQLHVQNTLYNSYKEQEATLLGTEYEPLQILDNETLVNKREEYLRSKFKNNILVQVWNWIISGDGGYRHPIVSFLLSVLLLSCSTLSIGIFLCCSLKSPDNDSEITMFIYTFIAFIALQVFLTKKWKRIGLYFLIIFIIAPIIAYAVFSEKPFSGVLILVPTLVILITLLRIKYKGVSFFSQTENLKSCIKDKKGVWKPFGVCSVLLICSYALWYLSYIENRRSWTSDSYDSADTLACDTAINTPLEVSDSILHFDCSGGTRTIYVTSSSFVTISNDLQSFGHTENDVDSICIQIKENRNKTGRTDYFDVNDEAGNTKRITINQDGWDDGSNQKSYDTGSSAQSHSNKSAER